MSSPSDDGQCTDSDKEEVSEITMNDSSNELKANKPISNYQKVEISGEKVETSNDSTLISDQEDEEVRLRRKLLERRTTATNRAFDSVLKSSRSAPGLTEEGLGKFSSNNSPKSSKTIYSQVVYDEEEEEELFSVPPKDSFEKRKAMSQKFHSDKERVKKNERKRKNDRERSKEDRYRQKDRERKHDRYRHDRSRDKKRDNIDRLRHISKKQRSPFHREREHFKASSSGVEKAKTGVHSYEKEKHSDNRSHVKEDKKTYVIHKRASPAAREFMDKPDVATKKPRIEIPEKSEKDESDTTSPSVKASERGENSESVGNYIKTETDEEMEDESHHQVILDKDDSSNRSDKGLVMNIPKYSKYDSSPESSVQTSVGDDASNMSDDSYYSEPERIAKLSDADDNDEDILLEPEELALLSPEIRAKVERIQTAWLIETLPTYYPGINGCRSVAEFECLNRIEEGTFGVVYRARDKRTDEVVALKRLKMEKEKEGFPITSLREINMLIQAGQHENIVSVKEIVVGSNMDKIYLVMEYVEHDMKSLMDSLHARHKNFTIGQVKTLLFQLLCGVAHLHDQWILHRDLKTSNLLLSHKGILKIGDFGLAREFGDPLKAYTPIVVTLWYRCPELLLGVHQYSTAVDIWSCGCIFAEFLKLKPLFPGKGELDQLSKIFAELGTPNEKIWPDFKKLPGTSKLKLHGSELNILSKRFPENVLDKRGFELLNELLRYDPAKRLSAANAAHHPWFKEKPLPTPPEFFPTWPAKSELSKTVLATKSPITKPPAAVRDTQADKLYKELKVKPLEKDGFSLKFDPVKFGNY